MGKKFPTRDDISTGWQFRKLTRAPSSSAFRPSSRCDRNIIADCSHEYRANVRDAANNNSSGGLVDHVLFLSPLFDFISCLVQENVTSADRRNGPEVSSFRLIINYIIAAIEYDPRTSGGMIQDERRSSKKITIQSQYLKPFVMQAGKSITIEVVSRRRFVTKTNEQKPLNFVK